jgi:predicted lipoprotein with Yx(FWY)xxD motif
MRRFLSATALVITLTVLAANCAGSDANGAVSDDVPGVDVAAQTEGTGTIRVTNTELGNVLTTDEGYTLYYFSLDRVGVSTCDDSCTILWPPYQPSEVSGTLQDRLTLIDRSDGSQQAAVDGKPVYLYTGDVLPGDTQGHGREGIWVAIGADGTAMAQ